jgi:hypothetical protein
MFVQVYEMPTMRAIYRFAAPAFARLGRPCMAQVCADD